MMSDMTDKHFDKLILTLLFVLLLFAIICYGNNPIVGQALISTFSGISGAIIALMTGSRNTPRKNDDTSLGGR